MSIDSVNTSYAEMLPLWEQCRDTIIGSYVVKQRNIKYLPRLSGHDNNDYQSYLDRSQYFNAMGQTKRAYTGFIFAKPPVKQTPEQLDDFMADPTLDNKSFDGLLNELVEEVIEVNKVGVLIDYPTDTTEGMTQLQVETMGIKPYWAIYKAETIINWRSKKVGSQLQLELVVLKEIYNEVSESDIYTTKEQIQYRVLRLDTDGNYTQEVFRNGNNTPVEVIEPMMNGSRMKFIPFYMINENGIDYVNNPVPPLYDLSEVNIGHYRNSADYEEELHKVSIKSIVGYGTDPNTPFKVGGYNSTPSTDAKFEMLEASQNSGLELEMKNKETRMAVLGSQAISGNGKYLQSAETAGINKSAENSMLASIANAVSRASEEMLRVTGVWLVNPISIDEEIKIQLNTDYLLARLPAVEQIALMQQYQAGLIDYETYIQNLKRGEIIDPGKTIEEIQENIKDNPPPSTNEIDEDILIDV